MGSVATSQLTSILGNSWPAWLTMDRIWPGNFGSPTLPETNISSENQWLEDDSFPFGMAYFQRRTVTFRESIPIGWMISTFWE